MAKTTKKPKTVKITRPSNPSGSVYENMRNELKAAQYSGSKNWKFKKGSNVIRLIPFSSNGETKVFIKETYHWFGKSHKPAAAPCPGKGCPVCALIDSVSGDAKKALYPKQRFLANIVDRATGEQAVADVPFSVFRDITRAIVGEDDIEAQVPNALDLKNGNDFQVKQYDEKGFTKYLVSAKMQPSPVGIDVKPVDLTGKKRKPMDADKLQEIANNLADLAPDTDEGDDE